MTATWASHGACGKRWTQHGEREGHCGGCHQTFVGVSAFDAHRRDRACLDPKTATNPKTRNPIFEKAPGRSASDIAWRLFVTEEQRAKLDNLIASRRMGT